MPRLSGEKVKREWLKVEGITILPFPLTPFPFNIGKVDTLKVYDTFSLVLIDIYQDSQALFNTDCLHPNDDPVSLKQEPQTV